MNRKEGRRFGTNTVSHGKSTADVTSCNAHAKSMAFKAHASSSDTLPRDWHMGTCSPMVWCPGRAGEVAGSSRRCLPELMISQRGSQLTMLIWRWRKEACGWVLSVPCPLLSSRLFPCPLLPRSQEFSHFSVPSPPTWGFALDPQPTLGKNFGPKGKNFLL